MIKIKGIKGPRSLKITEYCIVMNYKINPLLMNSTMWTKRNKLGLLYFVTITNNGYLMITLGFASVYRLVTIKQVMNKLSRLLNKLSGKVTLIKQEVIRSNHVDLIDRAIAGDKKAWLELQLINTSYASISQETSEMLYIAGIEAKNYICD